MARARKTQDKDVIARIADSGEDALRRLVDLPRRIVVQAVDDVDERLHELAARVRELDPLHGRVAALERRLDALEKTQARSGRASTRAKSARPRRPAASPAPEPEHARQEGIRAPQQGQAQAGNEGERTP